MLLFLRGRFVIEFIAVLVSTGVIIDALMTLILDD